MLLTASSAVQYPEGYLEAVAAKEKEKENKIENEVAETPTKGKRKRKSQPGKCNSFNFLNNCLFLSTVDVFTSEIKELQRLCRCCDIWFCSLHACLLVLFSRPTALVVDADVCYSM